MRQAREADGHNRLMRELWLEAKVAADYSCGYVPEDIRAQVRPPGWFKREELGLGTGEYPSIIFTMSQVLPRQRARAANEQRIAQRAELRAVDQIAERRTKLDARHRQLRAEDPSASYDALVESYANVHGAQVGAGVAEVRATGRKPKRLTSGAYRNLLQAAVARAVA